jgi:ribosomal protein S18 acetylase RimI-like enzyme
VEWDYGWWHASLMEREGFDPRLWFLALDGEDIVGACLSRLQNGQGWVNQLAVRRPWRKRGLGLALLRQALQEFTKRQIHRVGLSVDASNPTGATRLYEKAGMSVVHQYILFEKELSQGNETGR